MKKEKVLVQCVVNGEEVAEYVDPRGRHKTITIDVDEDGFKRIHQKSCGISSKTRLHSITQSI